MQRVVVIGAGASGLVAPAWAARAGADVTLIERTSDGGRKILLSGGGRCNLLPSAADTSRYVTGSSVNTLAKILRSWPLHELVRFFEDEVGVELGADPSGRRFPATERASVVRDGLLGLARRRGVRVVTSSPVSAVEPSSGGWSVSVSQGPAVEAEAVVLATGGLSYPATGSDGDGLRMLRRLGVDVAPTYPALTPVLAEDGPFRALAGVSLDVRLTATLGDERTTTSGGFLFTHVGYSGPAVLELSHVLTKSIATGGERPTLTVQWTTDGVDAWDSRLSGGGKRTVRGVIRDGLPARLAETLLVAAGVVGETRLGDLDRARRRSLIEALVRTELPWTGCGGYDVAEVMGGGVPLSAITPATMEVRAHPGLHLCGEMLDVFGMIGGYNFLWAWVTGRAAGVAAARRAS
jgi:predicted Rossmann fold flavoprotein